MLLFVHKKKCFLTNEGKCTDDAGTIETLTHLLTREITHTNMFMKALDGLGKLDDPFFGTVDPDESVSITFNLSQGNDFRGPWNSGTLKYDADPQPEGGMPATTVNQDDEKGKAAGERKIKEKA